MKQLFRIYLILSLLLLNGYSSIYTHALEKSVSYAALQISGKQAHAKFGKALHADAPISQFSPSLAEEDDEDIYAEEVEDEHEEEDYLKSYRTYFFDFYAYIFGIFSNNVNKCLPNGEHFSCPPSDRCILFQVIRI